MWKERFKRAREVVKKFYSDPRFKWYQRAIWAISVIWAGVVGAQSVSYYTYIGQGRNALVKGQYAEARDMFDAALKDVKGSFSYTMIGARDGRYANALNNLAELDRVTGSYSAAEQKYLEVRSVAERTKGKKSQEFALSTNNLAALYRDVARYDDSERLYKEALDVWEKLLKRTDDTKYAASLNGLAKLYRDEGRYDEAEKLYKRALEIRLAALGKDHQDTAEIIGNLGGLYRDTHNYSESEKCYNEAFKIDRKLLGETHPYVATDMNNLAGLYRDMGRHEEARTLFNKALAMRELSLGPDHPYCAKSLLGIVENSRQAGWKNDDGERLVQRALDIDEKAFGKDHPDYATACDTAFNYYYARGDLQKARLYNEAALRVRRKLLGTTHRDLQTSLKNQALLAKAQATKS
jgi:tetratricopeptide (TPR) repeat protein